MTEKELLKRAMKIRGITQEELAKKVGYSQQSAINSILNVRPNTRTDILVRLLNAMDYDLVIVDRTRGGILGKVEIPDRGLQMKNKPKKKEAVTEAVTEEVVKEPVKAEKKYSPPVYEYGKK